VTAFKRRGQWCAKYVRHGQQTWVPGGPWPTKREAQRAEARHRERTVRLRAEETCETFAARWPTEWPRPAASTRVAYEHAAQRFAAEFGTTPLDGVDRLTARAWALTVPRNLTKALATMFEDARNVGLVTHNPFSNLRLPTTERTEEVHPPSREEYRALLDACMTLGGYGPEFRAMIQFSAWTGVRAGELHALKWEDIDTEAQTIRVSRARKTDLSLGPPKNGHSRVICLLPPADVLDTVPRRPDEFVFHTVRGRPLDKGTHHYAWRTVRAASGIPIQRAEAGLSNIRWHDLRHACATWLLELGLDHFAVSIQLGHEDGGALVMSRYGHPSADAARQRLQRAFRTRDDTLAGLLGVER
jgi:integrase